MAKKDDMIATHSLHKLEVDPAAIVPGNLWLAAPFVVLALVVTTFSVTPLWIQRRAAELREPAYAALASSVQSLGRSSTCAISSIAPSSWPARTVMP